MKTSTPAGSPLRKKLSMAQSFLCIEDYDENEIESEKRTRRQENINKSTEQRRKSAVAPLLGGFSATQIAQHCKDCIKLSTENKINSKNAFSLLLIDVMAAMAKKNDSEISKNFQVASCTLDASVKIYGYRVDAVHTEVLKMAGGFRGKEVEVNEDDDEMKNDENEGEDGQPVKPKPKKKKKKATVVPSTTLNAKTEAEVLLDAPPQQNLLSMKDDGSYLFLCVPKYNDFGLLVLDPDFPCWPYDDNETTFPAYKEEEPGNLEDIISILNNIPVKDEELCPFYSNFQFGKDYDEEGESDDEMGASQNSNHFEFDMNTSVNDLPFAEAADNDQLENQRNRLEVPAGGYESDQEIIIQSAPCRKQNQNVAISDMKKIITVNELEYSIFDEKVFKAWAGPTYWKVRPTLNKRSNEEEKENEEVSKQVASKRTRKGKIKGIVGLFEISKDLLVKYLTSGDKSTLCKSTMLNWHPKNTTMPKDCKYKAKSLLTLFHIPAFEIKPRLEVDCEDDEDPICNTNEQQDEPEELDYCSSLVMRDETRSEPDENMTQMDLDVANDANDRFNDVETWDQQNMVAVPAKVEKIAVSTFKRKKHIDIKNLKKCIWNILTDSETSEKPETNKEVKIHKPIDFSQLIRTYPTKMPKSLSSSLSAPLIFNALLHLTNEKSLVLTQEKGDTGKFDFQVFQ